METIKNTPKNLMVVNVEDILDDVSGFIRPWWTTRDTPIWKNMANHLSSGLDHISNTHKRNSTILNSETALAINVNMTLSIWLWWFSLVSHCYLLTENKTNNTLIQFFYWNHFTNILSCKTVVILNYDLKNATYSGTEELTWCWGLVVRSYLTLSLIFKKTTLCFQIHVCLYLWISRGHI